MKGWLLQNLRPSADFKILECSYQGKPVSVFEITPARHTPVRFKEHEFIRVGSYKKKLRDFPEKERTLWVRFSQPFERDVAKAVKAPAAKFNITLRQAVGGNRSGILYPTTNSWFWLITDVSVINNGADDTISFELRIPKGDGLVIFRPLNVLPPGFPVSANTRLLGVERSQATVALTGALLFELNRDTTPKMPPIGFADDVDEETRQRVRAQWGDQPDTRRAIIVVRSELTGDERQFNWMELSWPPPFKSQ